MPSMDSIVAIAKIFNVTTDVLLNNDVEIKIEEKSDLPKEQNVLQQETEETNFDNTDNETKKDSTLPSKRKSGWIIGLLLLLIFTQALHPYIESDLYDSALQLGLFDFCLLSIIMMIVPSISSAIKTDISIKGIKLLCSINSIVIFSVSLALYICEVIPSMFIGWIVALLYYFVNKHILFLIKKNEFSKKKALIWVLVIMIVLVLIVAISVLPKLLWSSLEEPTLEDKDTLYLDGTYDGVAPPEDTINPNNKYSYDIKEIVIIGSAGNIYSCMIEHTDYLVSENELGEKFVVNYKVIGGIGQTHFTQVGNILIPAYGNVEDWWYNITLPDGTEGFVWGGTDGMYVEEITNDIEHTTQLSEDVSQSNDYQQSALDDICFELGCDSILNGLGSYCAEYTCNENGCISQKAFNSNYCLTHGCSAIGCENGRKGYGRYCVDHTCIKNSCSYKKEFSSSYCTTHKCSDYTCDNAAVIDGSYCSEHKCSKSTCTSEKTVLSEYCLLHKS